MLEVSVYKTFLCSSVGLVKLLKNQMMPASAHLQKKLFRRKPIDPITCIYTWKFKMTDSEDSATGTSRIRTLTKKGKIYQVELLKEQLSSAQRAWRKQMNNVSNVIVDSSDVDVLKSERSFLEAKMEILNAANERLYKSLEENFNDKR